MTEEEKAAAGPVPPFIGEHMVDMNRGWIEYCYEGCVDETGNLTHYGLTEEVYFQNHVGLAYVTPPMNYPVERVAALEQYLGGYMAGLIEKGYLKQFFNIEFWALAGGEGGEFCFCEINPRCAHSYHFGYKFAYGTSLYGDNFNLVLKNEAPDHTPWKEWKAGRAKISCEVLINAKTAAPVTEILDYDYVEFLDRNEADKIRYIKPRDYVLSDEDANSAAGCTIMQIWITTNSHAEAAAKEMEIREKIYKIKQDDQYPQFWVDMANQYRREQDESKYAEGKLGVCVHFCFSVPFVFWPCVRA